MARRRKASQRSSRSSKRSEGESSDSRDGEGSDASQRDTYESSAENSHSDIHRSDSFDEDEEDESERQSEEESLRGGSPRGGSKPARGGSKSARGGPKSARGGPKSARGGSNSPRGGSSSPRGGSKSPRGGAAASRPARLSRTRGSADPGSLPEEFAEISKDVRDGSEEEDNSQDGYNEEEEEEDSYGSSYFEDEESEYEIYEESESEIEEDEPVMGDLEKGVPQTARLSVTSEFSNETERSDLEIFEAQRNTAQVLPEPPWAKSVAHMWQCIYALFLPAVLVLLTIYAFFKCLQAMLTVVKDILHVLARIAWILVRVALSPLYIIWKLCLPRFIQRSIAAEFDKRVARRLRSFVNIITSIKDTVFDAPNIALACAYAAIETCVLPAKRLLGACCWKYVGTHVNRLVNEPMIDANVNRSIKNKKRQAGFHKKEREAKRMSSLLDESRAQRRRQAARQRRKKLMHKKKAAKLEIVLRVQVLKSGKPVEHRVQLKDKSQNQMISRTMIVERRYAIAVGFVWFNIGLGWLIMVVDGADGETCTICEDNADLRARICRNGRGRDCAFHFHTNEVLIAIGICAVGMMLLAYSVFLYKPVRLAQKKDVEAAVQKWEEAEQRADRPGPPDDPDVLTVRMVQELKERVTCPRLVRSAYRSSPFSACQRCFTRQCIDPLAHRFARWEASGRLRDRSIALQYYLYMLAGGWVLAARRAILRYLRRVVTKVYGDQPGITGESTSSTFDGGAADHLRASRAQRCLIVSTACCLHVFCCCLFRTDCGERCLTRFGRSKFAGMLRSCMGIHGQRPSEEGWAGDGSSGRRGKSMIGIGNRRTQGGGFQGGRNIEETLEQFGFDGRDAKEVEIEARKKAEAERQQDAAARRAAMEELTTGLAETQREAGALKGEAVVEMELEDIGPAEEFEEVDEHHSEHHSDFQSEAHHSERTAKSADESRSEHQSGHRSEDIQESEGAEE